MVKEHKIYTPGQIVKYLSNGGDYIVRILNYKCDETEGTYTAKILKINQPGFAIPSKVGQQIKMGETILADCKADYGWEFKDLSKKEEKDLEALIKAEGDGKPSAFPELWDKLAATIKSSGVRRPFPF